jgi:hypothetical protein
MICVTVKIFSGLRIYVVQSYPWSRPFLWKSQLDHKQLGCNNAHGEVDFWATCNQVFDDIPADHHNIHRRGVRLDRKGLDALISIKNAAA